MKPHPSLLAALLSLVTASAFARETPPIGASPPPPRVQSPPAAEQPAPQPTPARGDRHGFYGHVELGGGYRTLAFTGQDSRVMGAGIGFSMLVGGSLTRNLFLVGELSVNNIVNPTVQTGGKSVQMHDAQARFLTLGPGIVYYVMPAQVSLGASLLLSQASLGQDGVEVAESDLGYGGSARVGKEWWIGKSSGLGVSAAVMLASMKDKGGTSPLVATAYTLAAAYTY